ncbi:MAG: tetratricopeptide repeat protein [Spirochaetes bacterium]|nr:tetratricopeptide repeat protein [Spirochaetota bacterium]
MMNLFFRNLTAIIIAAAVLAAQTNTNSVTNAAAESLFQEMTYVESGITGELKEITTAMGDDIMLQIVTTNFSSYVRLTEIDTNYLEFVSMTRDKMRSQLLLKAHKEGTAQVSVELIEDLTVRSATTYRVTITPPTKRETAVVGKKDKDTEDRRYYLIAMDLFKARAYAEAKEMFNRVVQKFTGTEFSGKSINALGDIAMAQSNYSEALANYKRGSETGTGAERERSLLSLGRCQAEMKDLSKALASFLSLERLYPDSVYAGDALFFAAQTMTAMKNRNGAVDTLSRSISRYKQFEKRAESIYLLASLYDKGGSEVRDLAAAHKYYGEYITQYPSGPQFSAALERRTYLDKNFINLR